MSEPLGPFIVPTGDGNLALIHNDKRVNLDHQTAEHWWWVLSEYMKRWAEEQRERDGRHC